MQVLDTICVGSVWDLWGKAEPRPRSPALTQLVPGCQEEPEGAAAGVAVAGAPGPRGSDRGKGGRSPLSPRFPMAEGCSA